jgi:hypothetical protein
MSTGFNSVATPKGMKFLLERECCIFYFQGSFISFNFNSGFDNILNDGLSKTD